MNNKSKAPEIQVGIFSEKQITFSLDGIFRIGKKTLSESGTWIAECKENKLFLEKGNRLLEPEEIFVFEPVNPEESSFTLHSVTIGINFHWERREDQVFRGSLKLITEDGKVTAVNILTIEDYLISVISSEMKATSSKELLKAHSVISRGWLLAQIGKSRTIKTDNATYDRDISTAEEIIRWYDREDHRNYDVCADDHCQRYQGISRSSTPVVEQVIEETYGEVLTSNGVICDTRYYKCCGGITELFENVWEPVNHPYLQKITDNPVAPQGFNLSIDTEERAEKWILGNPEAFCNTTDKNVLSQVLNDYDQETNDFFRWKVTYTQNELSELVKTRSGIDFGTVTELIPMERGSSGRIFRLKIVGTRKSMIIGKELEIRKTLSRTHLYSSCFFVEKAGNEKETYFVLHGAGWGHGVGLCQIGAAVMGAKGYSYREILRHYFRETTLEKKY
jgi:stage II sporulation protein D